MILCGSKLHFRFFRCHFRFQTKLTQYQKLGGMKNTKYTRRARRNLLLSLCLPAGRQALCGSSCLPAGRQVRCVPNFKSRDLNFWGSPIRSPSLQAIPSLKPWCCLIAASNFEGEQWEIRETKEGAMRQSRGKNDVRPRFCRSPSHVLVDSVPNLNG
jgi:hypothetical protein